MYGAGCDFPVCNSVNPGLEYMLAAVPRSGSTHLAVELWRPGLMGAPMEYANPHFRDIMRQRFNQTENLLAYWHEVKRHRTSPNGVFGFKMFITNYINEARESPEFLAQIAPAKVIFLTRSDLVAQAVSYSKAIRSCAWFDGVDQKCKAEYDPAHILYCLEMLKYQVAFWRELFTSTGTVVHHVTYEALAANRERVVRGCAEFLDVQLDPRLTTNLPRMRQQRNAESVEWQDRFRNEDRQALLETLERRNMGGAEERRSNSDVAC